MALKESTYPQISFPCTTLKDDSLLGHTRRIVWNNTIPLQLDILKSTGRYNAFKLQHDKCYDDEPDHWPIPNHLFWDSDVAKWIEGACYFLHDNKDQILEEAIQELVEMIRSAQQPDGYLNIHFTVVAPAQRYTNLRDLHELYNAGHLIEAALAHEHLYNNGGLLDPILKYVKLMSDTFGRRDGQIHGYPGHPEIELALLRLYSHTQDPSHLELARYFIEERGNPQGCEGRHFYDVEAEQRGERPYERPNYYPRLKSYWYQQAHVPIVQQREIVGHSVRAMYLLTAVADMTAMARSTSTRSTSTGITKTDSIAYKETLTVLWENMVSRKMSVTGGIGAMKQWEGFGVNDFLPQSTDEGGCYNETCASIGIVLLGERMLNLQLDHRYADVMELALYNTVLTGMGRCGKKFTYVNQLGSSDEDLSKREDWFTCACCPPNVSRLLGSIGGFIWSATIENAQERTQVVVNVHLFTSATLKVPTKYGVVEVVQESKYPLEEPVTFQTTFPREVNVILRVRIPSWAEGWSVRESSHDVICSKADDSIDLTKGRLYTSSWVS